MNRISAFGLFSCLMFSLAAAPRAHSQADDGAVLRCDPHVIVYKIDGESNVHAANGGSRFRDCTIPLAAGPHTLEVCYDASSQSMNTTTTARCDKDQQVSFERVVNLRQNPAHFACNLAFSFERFAVTLLEPRKIVIRQRDRTI